MALLDDVKLTLRIESSTTIYDGELNNLIEGAKAYIIGAGVPEEVVTDPDYDVTNYAKVKILVMDFVKNQFGYSATNNVVSTDKQGFSQVFDIILNQLKIATQIYDTEVV